MAARQAARRPMPIAVLRDQTGPAGPGTSRTGVESLFTLVVPEALEPPICRDPDDDLVVATARTGECDAIVTGDQDLLVLDPFQGRRVLTPSGFWKWESANDER